MLTLLRRKTAAYVGRHADDDRAPTGTRCLDCGKTEPGTSDEPTTLARCSICEAWRCSTCFSQHELTPPPVVAEVTAPLWKRVIRRG